MSEKKWQAIDQICEHCGKKIEILIYNYCIQFHCIFCGKPNDVTGETK